MTAQVGDRLSVEVGAVEAEVSVLHRPGPGLPIVFLHGFGCTKEDYADVLLDHRYAAHEVLAWDAPGFGASRCSDLSAVDLPFLVATAEAVLSQYGIRRFHLVGHSMGGVTALLLAESRPETIASFTDIEGNLAPEDCFMSRQIHVHADPDPARFLASFADRTSASTGWGSSSYAATLEHKVQPAVVRSVFESLVELSDTGALLSRFLALPFPRQFMYGDQNRHLSYLPALAAGGVELAEIERCGHFPMYSNPPQAWRRIADFLGRTGC